MNSGAPRVEVVSRAVRGARRAIWRECGRRSSKRGSGARLRRRAAASASRPGPRQGAAGVDRSGVRPRVIGLRTNSSSDASASISVDDVVDLRDKCVGVLGLGSSGLAAARLACDRKARRVVLMDNGAASPTETQKKAMDEVIEAHPGTQVEAMFGPHEADHLSGVDLLVVSPGVSSAALEAIKPSQGPGCPDFVSEFAFAVGEIQACGVPIAAVTGTNGKTTVAHFTDQLLRHLGKRSVSCGNIGTPISEVALSLRERAREARKSETETNGATSNGSNGSSDDGGDDGKDLDLGLDAVVVEVSSYQLELPSRIFHPKVAVILNLAQDHLERHGSMAAYAKAKANICLNMDDARDLLVLPHEKHTLAEEEVRATNTTCSRVNMGDLPGVYLQEGGEAVSVQLPWWFDHRDFLLGDFGRRCLGDHNAWNAGVAVLLCFALGFDWPKIQVEDGIENLEAPPHRLEVVATAGGVTFVNDSKATNVESTLVALKALPHKPIVLLGGQAKRTPKDRAQGEGEPSLGFDKVLAFGKCEQKAIITFGESGKEIASELESAGAEGVVSVAGLGEAFEKALEIASPGDTVLLSPACASFDAFKNFEERGDYFKGLVEELK